jgi:cell division protein FtsZ
MGRIKLVEEELRAVIKVVGIGGGGGNAVNRMAEAGLRDVEIIAANTDAQALRGSRAGVRLQIGENITKGLGVGGDPAKGRLAGVESQPMLREALHGADLVFITAGMGGGTGTGVAPIAAQAAKAINALTIGVVTKPFGFEGPNKTKIAVDGIKALREHVDTLLVIPNDRLLENTGQETLMREAFMMADEVLRRAVQSISDIITMPGHMNMDLEDIRSIMNQGGNDALVGVGEAGGRDRAARAQEIAVNSPLLENASIDGAKGLIVNFVSDGGLKKVETEAVMNSIGRSIDPGAKVKMGEAIDESLGDHLRIMVIATGFPPNRERGFSGRGRRLFRAPALGPDPSRPQAGSAGDLSKPAYLRHKVQKLR